MCGWCHSELNKQCDILVRLGVSFSAFGSIAIQYSEFKKQKHFVLVCFFCKV